MLHTPTPREEKIGKMRYGLEDGPEHTLEEVGRSFTLTRESGFATSKPGPCASCAKPARSRKLQSFLDAVDE